MNYKELMEKSRDAMGTKLCKSCFVCDGKACRNTVPGPGDKGIGDVAMRNYDATLFTNERKKSGCDSILSFR